MPVEDTNTRPLLELVLRVKHWTGEPQLMEPDKCSAWAWWPKTALPHPIVPYAKAALEGIAVGSAYAENSPKPACPTPPR